MKTPLLLRLFFKDVLDKLNMDYLNDISSSDLNRYINLYELDYFYNLFSKQEQKTFNNKLFNDYELTINCFKKHLKQSQSKDFYLIMYAYICYYELKVQNLLDHTVEKEVLKALGLFYNTEISNYELGDFSINLFEIDFIDKIYREIAMIPNIKMILPKASKNAYKFYKLQLDKNKNLKTKIYTKLYKKDYSIYESENFYNMNKYAVALNEVILKIQQINKKLA